MLNVLGPTDEERTQARAGLLAGLPTEDPWILPDVIGKLTDLGSTTEDRAQLRAGILTVLTTAHPQAVDVLLQPLVPAASWLAWWDGDHGPAHGLRQA